MILNENQREMYKKCMFLNEGFINQTFMGLKIHPHQNIDETFKKHKYEGYLNLINRTKNVKDLEYIRKDLYLGISTFKRVGERIEKCSKLGDCDETKNYYNSIKRKYLDKGITIKDVELTMKWFKEVALKTLNEKLKKAKKLNEDTVLTEGLREFFKKVNEARKADAEYNKKYNEWRKKAKRENKDFFPALSIDEINQFYKLDTECKVFEKHPEQLRKMYTGIAKNVKTNNYIEEQMPIMKHWIRMYTPLYNKLSK